MTGQRNKELSQYANWLNQNEWTYWATFTTRYELTLPSARRAMERQFNLMNKFGPTRMFWAAEPFDAKEGFHTHALLQVKNGIRYEDIIECWQIASGNRPKIGTARAAARKARMEGEKPTWNRVDLQVYDPLKGAGAYVSKYITKRGSDYDLLNTFGLPPKTKSRPHENRQTEKSPILTMVGGFECESSSHSKNESFG
jgi:hypothetical protein